MTKRLTNAAWMRAYKRLADIARAPGAAKCVICVKRCCRVGATPADVPVLDVMCQHCFECAPTEFKATTAQQVFRQHIKAGAHLRIAERAAYVRGEAEIAELMAFAEEVK